MTPPRPRTPHRYQITAAQARQTSRPCPTARQARHHRQNPPTAANPTQNVRPKREDKSRSNVKTSGAPLRNRTVDLLLTIENQGRFRPSLLSTIYVTSCGLCGQTWLTEAGHGWQLAPKMAPILAIMKP